MLMNSFRSQNPRFLACSVASIAIALAAPAYAQSDDKGGLEEIVVTAQKRAQGANDVGITLNAFTGEQLAERGLSSAEDIALFTPGLTVNETSATGVPLYTIRGVGFQDYSTAASSTVGIYFDEVAVPYTVMSRGAVFDVERVEVLKGPQGDLYGRNTTAGQINYVSKLPTDTAEGSLSVGVSSFQTLDVEGHVSGPLANGINGRFAFTTTQSEKGWQKSLTRDDRLGEKNVVALRGMLDFDLGGGNLLLRGQYVKDKSDNKANTAYNGELIGLGEFALPYAPLLPYMAPGAGDPPWYSVGDNQAADWTNTYTDPNGKVWNIRPRRDNELVSLSARLSWDLTDGISLTSITAYDDFQREEANDWDGTAANDSSNINTSDISVFSQELRLNGETDKLNWVAGLYYSDDKVEEFYNYFMSDSLFGNGGVVFGVPPFSLSPIYQLNTRYRQDTTSKAVFAHVEYNLTEALRVTGGLRYTDEKRKWRGCTFDAGEGSLANFLNFSFGATLAPGSCGTIDDDPNSPGYIFALIGGPNVNNAFHVYEETLRAKKWMYKLGLDYKVTDDVLLYATYSHGFKSGGFNGANSNTTKQLKGYKPEELDSYEAGVKSTLFEGTMQFNAAAFYYDYKNKQEQDLAVTFVGNISGLTNVPKSRIYGAEADIQWAPLDGLMFNFGAAYLNAKVKKWMAVSNDSVWPGVEYFDAKGITLAQAPKWQLNAGAEYGFGVSESLELKFGADANYKGKTSGGVSPQNATEAYTVVNARVTLANDESGWSLMVWSRNLFDNYYYPAAYRGGNGPYVRSTGMPRTFGVTAGFNF